MWLSMIRTFFLTNVCLILIFFPLCLSAPLSSLSTLTLCGKKHTDDMIAQKEKNKLLQEEMEATLQDIQNM